MIVKYELGSQSEAQQFEIHFFSYTQGIGFFLYLIFDPLTRIPDLLNIIDFYDCSFLTPLYFTAPRGTFYSNMHGINYGNSITCSFFLVNPHNGNISIWFASCNWGGPWFCDRMLCWACYSLYFYAFVQIHDGPDFDSPLLDTFHGTLAPFSVNSTTSALSIKFTTDNMNSLSGFRAFYVFGITPLFLLSPLISCNEFCGFMPFTNY